MWDVSGLGMFYETYVAWNQLPYVEVLISTNIFWVCGQHEDYLSYVAIRNLLGDWGKRSML